MKPPRRRLAPLTLFFFLSLVRPILPGQSPANPLPPAPKTTPSAPSSASLPGGLLPSTGLPLGLPPSNPSGLAPLPLSTPEPFNPRENGSQKVLGDFPEFELNTRKPEAPIPDGPNRTEESALRRNQRIHYRQTKAQALLSPEVQSALEASRKARSDRELRAALQTHYERLYSRMAEIDPSLATLLEEQKKRSIAPLQQTLGREPLLPSPLETRQP